MPMRKPLPAAYHRGFRHALQAAANIANERKAVCEAASEYHGNAGNGEERNRELCAAREAVLIAERILQLEPVQLDDRALKGRPIGTPK